MLAKRRRKKNTVGTVLKYEVYGILIITLSVIAMSGQGWPVDQALANLFGLFFGDFYFVVPLAGIYAGLVTMIKRKWPSRWTTRMTGLAIILLFFLLTYTATDVEAKTGPRGEPVSVSAIMMHARDIRELATPGEFYAIPIIEKNLSGGYIGAVAYALLFYLFGNFGAKFITFVLLLIGIMLVTGKSYVELALLLRKRIGQLVRLLRLKLSDSRRRSAAHAKAQPAAVRAEPNEQVNETEADESPLILLDDDDELIDDDDSFTPRPAQRSRRTLFFPWFGDARRKPEEDDPLHEPDISAAAHGDRTEGSGAEGADGGRLDAEPEIPLEGIGGWRAEPHAEQPGEYSGASEQPAPENAPRDLAAEAPPWQPDLLPHPDESAPVFPAGQEGPVDEAHGDASSAGSAPAAAAGGDAGKAGAAADSEEPPKPSRPYLLPPMSLLSQPRPGKSGVADHGEARRKLEATLESFGVKATVLDVVRGPAVTRYEVQPAAGVKVSRIVNLTDDIALALAAKDIRMEAPIPGKSAIGIEVPNTEVSMVTLREVMETPAFQNAASKLSVAFGRDISGQPIVGDLARMPHLLVAGATGSGKSVCINGIITSLLYKAAPDEVKFLMVDPKMVELNVYNGIPHLLAPVVTDPRRASLALKKIVAEMERRYEAFSKSGTRNIEGYNALMKDNPSARLPYIVVIVDELADLMMVAASDVEDSITRLAQMARAAGIHLIIATQRPSVDVITGVIKANIPSRIAFGVSSQVDSRTILDMVGAEKLLGRGDMLFLPVGLTKPIRVQGAFLSDQEVEAVVQFVRSQAEADYKEDLVPEVEDAAQDEDDELDELFDQAVQVVVEAKQASVSLLQRRMRIGYARAARLIDQLEARGIVGPYEGSKPREVLISEGQYPPGQISS